MKQPAKKMELLAPAGDWEALKAGVAGGADAFYLGGKLFNARQNAVNFDLSELAEVADYLHLRGRKMYVTVNTLIKEDELTPALDYIAALYELGVDALIIQDMGLLYLIRRLWPDLEVHASTQMTVTDVAGVRLLQELGVKRVVLAREVSVGEIAEIYRETGMELEVFVHGALCVSYSGACLFSSLIGGRSGNRGRCAQPCRMEYQLIRSCPQTTTGFKEKDLSLVQTEGAHLLSPKDISLLPYLPALAAAGVKSLKIEGRMKGPEYVGTVVRVYRNALHRLEAEAGHFRPEPDELKTLETVFNRGLSAGYLHQDLGPELMSAHRPSNRGRFLGRVTAYNQQKGRVTVALEAGIREGDGIEVWVKKGGRLGAIVEDLRLNGVRVEKAAPGDIVVFALPKSAYPGDRVFLTSSRKITEQIQKMLRNDFVESRLPCRLQAWLAPNQPLVATCWDQEGHSVTVTSEEKAGVAKKRPVTEEVLKEHLTRMGDSPFIVEEFQAEISGEPIFPYGKIHELRRRIVQELSAKRLERYRTRRSRPAALREVRIEAEQRRTGRPRTGKSYFTVYAGDLKTLEVALSLEVTSFIIGGETYQPSFRWDRAALQQAAEIIGQAGAELTIALPKITRQRERTHLTDYLNFIQELNPAAVLVTFPGSVQRVLAETKLPIYLDYGFHTLNSYGATLLAEKTVKGFTFSPELSRKEIISLLQNTELNRYDLELVVFGPIELMVSQFCPIGAWVGGSSPQECTGTCREGRFFLRDRKGIDFPVLTDEFCRMHLLNSRDLCLVREVPDLSNRALRLRLDLRYYPAQTNGEIIRIFQEAYAQEKAEEEWRVKVWAELERITGRKLTRGHYHRGIM
ncbi:MAG TPA: DUF3656 domain-containing protein [Bacillota bacterium]